MDDSATFRTARPESTPSLDSSPKGETNTASYVINKEASTDSEFENNLEAWETEGKKKYVNEYFDTHNISSDFSVKMSVGLIDKYVRSEMAEKKYANTVDNYRKILGDIESEIGSDRLELFERFNKLKGYINALTRLKKAKQSLGAYKPDVRQD